MHPFVLGLIKAGNEVCVVSPFHPSLRIKEFSYRIITYKYIWPNSLHLLGYSQTLSEGTRFRLITYLLSPFLYIFGCIALIRLFRKERFDIISSHWILPNGFIGYIVSKITGIPYTVTLAGSDVYVAHKNIIFSQMARLAADESAAICSDSPQYIKELKKIGTKFKFFFIIPYPVDTSLLKAKKTDLSQIRRKFNIPHDKLILLAVGRLIHKKGFSYLLEAFAKVVEKQKNIFLIVVGDGDLRSNLVKLASELKVNDFIRFAGNIERNKIASFYNLADIFIMPSIKDEKGNIDDRPVALLEAIAFGIPAVASNFPGNALSIKDSISGFLVPQKNVEALSKAITELIKSDSLRKSMGMHAKKIASKQFDMAQVGKKYTSIFESVVKLK